MTDDELRALLQVSDDDLAHLFPMNAKAVSEMLIVFYQCGLRLGEVCQLTFRQIRGDAI